jgi:hypothetical protein
MLLQEAVFSVTMFSVRLPHWKGLKWGKRAVKATAFLNQHYSPLMAVRCGKGICTVPLSLCSLSQAICAENLWET